MLLSKTVNQIRIILIISKFECMKTLLRKRDNAIFNISITMTALSQIMNCGLTITQLEITLEQIIHLNAMDHEFDLGCGCMSFTAITVLLLILISVTTSLVDVINRKMKIAKKIFTWMPVALSVLLINEQLM